MTYANDGSYDNIFINRSDPGFVLQMGGWAVTPANGIDPVASKGLVDNEAHGGNIRGTLALARPDDHNPATDDKGANEFFFNLADNRGGLPALDTQNGGFTTFAEVTSASGLA